MLLKDNEGNVKFYIFRLEDFLFNLNGRFQKVLEVNENTKKCY